MFQRVFKKNFQGSLKGVTRKLQDCFKKVSGKAKGISSKFEGCFK